MSLIEAYVDLFIIPLQSLHCYYILSVLLRPIIINN